MPSKPRLWVRFGHWLSGFVVHVMFSITALGVAINDWDRDCGDDDDLEITGSGWLITSEAIMIIYAVLLIPGFLLWEMHPGRRIHNAIILNIYSFFVILLFSLILIGWDILGIFLLFEEIYKCRNSGMWVMSVISLIRSWIHFMYPLSVIILREIEEAFMKP